MCNCTIKAQIRAADDQSDFKNFDIVMITIIIIIIIIIIITSIIVLASRFERE